MALTVEPDQAGFPSAGGTTEHILFNLGTKRLAVKLRCSNNNQYRMSPVMCFIEPGQEQKMFITRLTGPVRIDKVVIQFTESAAEDTDVKQKFNDVAKELIGKIRIMLKVEAKSRKPNV